jgi:hypothetical protein
LIDKEKTLIILDTNKIRKNLEWEKDFTDFEPKGDFLKVIDFIQSGNFSETIFIGIPQIVIDELINARTVNFNKAIVSIKQNTKKLEMFPETNFENIIYPNKEFQYQKYMQKLVDDYIEKNNFIVKINLEKEKYHNVFEKLMDKAIKKYQPFEKKGRGFKDAIIWETILNYGKLNDYSYYFLLTENTKDFDRLSEDFESSFNEVLTIISSTELLLIVLEEIYQNMTESYKLMKFLNSEYFLEKLNEFVKDEIVSINTLESIREIESIKKIESSDFNDLGFTLEKEEFEVFRKISLLAKTKTDLLRLIIIFDTIK